MAIYNFLWLQDLSIFQELGLGRITVIMGERIFTNLDLVAYSSAGVAVRRFET